MRKIFFNNVYIISTLYDETRACRREPKSRAWTQDTKKMQQAPGQYRMRNICWSVVMAIMTCAVSASQDFGTLDDKQHNNSFDEAEFHRRLIVWRTA